MRDVDFTDIPLSIDPIRIDGEADGAITVPDATQLFTAEFSREGSDLVLQADGFADLRIEGYFADGTPADLVSPDGAVLRGHLVERLAGPLAAGQYAQSGDAATDGPIGQVETIEGAAFATRSDGTRVTLDLGAKVYQNDVISTGDGGKVSITFADGTIFSLAANSRMVLDELVYASDGGDNSATFNLIEGSFVFIAGEVAKTGGMEVNTPSATMGIRGTTVKVEFVSESGVTQLSLHFDPDGGTGQIEVYDRFGNFLGTITSTDEKWIINPEDDEPLVVDRTIDDDASDAEILADAARAYALAYGRVAGGENFVEQPSGTRQPGDGTGQQNDPPNDGGDDGQNDGGNDTGDDGSQGGTTPGNGTGGSNDNTEEETRFDDGEEERRAQNDTATGEEDGEVTIDISANDDASLSVIAVSNGAFGTTQLNEDGTVTYSPNPNASGVDSFTYTTSDSAGTTETATVTVVLAPVNDNPEAGNDTASGDENKPLTITVLGNDTDIDGDSLSVLSATDGELGSTEVNADGTITYTPFGPGSESATFSLSIGDTEGGGTPGTVTDTFTYTVTDNNGGTDTASVTVTLTLLNDPPVARDDSTETVEDTDVTITVLSNDSDANGDTVFLSGAGDGALGTTVVNENGTITYTPNADANGTDSFTYTISDGNGATDTATVTVFIAEANDPPVARDESTETVEDAAVTIPVLFNDDDPDGDSVFVAGAGDGLLGTTVVNETGTITYTPNADANGSDTFTYTVSDGNGATDTATVTVFISAVNDDPVARDDDAQGREGAPLTIEVLANDRDVDGDAITVASASDGELGSTTVNANGTITYTPYEFGSESFALSEVPGPLTDSFSYTVTDGNGATDTATVTVQIRPQAEIILGSSEDDSLPGGEGDEEIFGLAGSDTIDGGGGNDSLFGDEGADTLRGGDGDDFLSGGGPLGDLLEGGAGDDVLEYSTGTDTFDGGTGRDTLLVVTGGAPGSDLLPVLSGSGIEAIDLNNGSVETLNVTYQDVMNLSTEADTVLEALLGAALPDSATIYGDAGDQVNLAGDTDGEWQTGDSVVDNDGNDLTVYQFVSNATNDVLATLAIDDDVQVNLPTA